MTQKYSSLPTGEYDDEEIGGRVGKSLQNDRRMREQDEGLEVLGGSLLRLGDISLAISKEIDSQNILLNGLEVDLDKANESVDRLTKTTKAIVKKAGGHRNLCIIITLFIILVVLTFFVIYT